MFRSAFIKRGAARGRRALILAPGLTGVVALFGAAAGAVLFSPDRDYTTLFELTSGPAAGVPVIEAITRQPIDPSAEVLESSPDDIEPVASFTNDLFEDQASSVEINADDATIRYYNGRPIRPVRSMTVVTTAYSPDARSCAPFDDGITASGYSVWTNGGRLIAADKSMPFGTLVSVPGYNGGRPTPVLDRGSKIKGNRLDLLYATHEEALQWGVQRQIVTIWEYADGAG